MAGWKVNYFFSWCTSLLVNRFRSPARHDFNNILVIRLDEIGDVVTTMPVFDRLRERFPQAEITAWVLPLTADLVHAQPAVDHVVTDRPPPGKRYDLVVELRGNARTRWYALRQRPHFRLDRGTVRFRNKFLLKQHPHEVATNLQVLEPVTGKMAPPARLRIHTEPSNEKAAAEFLASNGIGAFAVFHAGARKPLRRWPGDKFAALGKSLHGERKLDVVFVGVPGELEAIDTIRAAMPFRTHVFSGHSLLDFVALARRAALFVGNESGPMHLASAAGIPVIGLFGPGEPHVFAPYGDRCTFIHHKLECNPCGQVVCKHPANTCMDRIGVEEVVAKIGALNLQDRLP